uniref:BPTI/Kunitz inhibitor domain-containing protein n=1 Tax=Poecilia mexicana TaxID=48701 RepID=A0A3B3X7V3_9TELE
ALSSCWPLWWSSWPSALSPAGPAPRPGWRRCRATGWSSRWFFDRTVAACSPFWYGGCGGNANRFSSEHECFRTCGVQSKRCALRSGGPITEGTSFRKGAVRYRGNNSQQFCDACLQRQDPGGCQDYAMMWFFDTVQNECARFWYGGCDGNANRFETSAGPSPPGHRSPWRRPAPTGRRCGSGACPQRSRLPAGPESWNQMEPEENIHSDFYFQPYWI